MPRKQSNTFRAVKGEGRKVNVETGVEILTSGPARDREYEVRGPSRTGYITVGTFDSKAAATDVALATVGAIRNVQDNDYERARRQILAEVEAVVIPADAPKPAHVLISGARHSAQAGFTAVAIDRMRRALAIVADPSLVPSDADAALALTDALALIGRTVTSNRHGETCKVTSAYIEAETNRVVLSAKFNKGYASIYAAEASWS